MKLARDFARDFTAEWGLAYTLAIHDEDGHNPHAHLMWCDRQDDGFAREREQWFKRAIKTEPSKGGAAKVSELNGPAWVHQVRADWELAANTALELAGERAQIDCRSYADQDRDKPEHARRIPQIHLGVTTKVMERKGVVTPRLKRWQAIAAEREEQRKEIAARQAAARAAQQRAHMKALRGRMEPVRREDVAEDASRFDADTVESPPPAVEASIEDSAPEEDAMTLEELRAWEAEHYTSDYDMVAQALERDVANYQAQLEREERDRQEEELRAWEAEHCMSSADVLEQTLERDAANYRAQLERESQEELDRQEELLRRLREVNPKLDVGHFQTMETVSGLYLDWDIEEGLGFVHTKGDEILAIEAPDNHEEMRGRQVDVQLNEAGTIEVAPRQREQEPPKEELTVREYKQFLADTAQKTVVNLSHQPAFEGRMLGCQNVEGQRLALVKNEHELLVTPSTPSLEARYNKDVVVYAERGPDGGLRARAKSKSRGMGR